MNCASEIEDEEMPQKWDQMIEDMAAGRIPILDVLKISYSKTGPEQDYFEHVKRTRAFLTMLRDKRLVLKLAEEITEVGKRESTAFESGVQKIDKTVRSKDGYRRFQKLMDIQSDVFADAPSLLNGKNFDECLKQYLSIISYVEGLWADACSLFNRQHYPLATFTSILVIEEIGKLGRLWWDLLGYDQPPKAKKKSNQAARDHRKKHFMGVIAGAVNNARLDRVLGLKRIKQLLQDAESGKIEELRQSCLYLDNVDGHVVTPADRIDAGTACFFTALAGELMAELLGHFPWEFERMIEAVIVFEESAGFDSAVVRRGGKVAA